jgi:hypothetical protein
VIKRPGSRAFPAAAVRVVPDDGAPRMDVARAAPRSSRATARAGKAPFSAWSPHAGTTNTGARSTRWGARRRACAPRERLWLHVDARLPGGVSHAHRTPAATACAGIEHADSITLRPAQGPSSCRSAPGALLVRDPATLRAGALPATTPTTCRTSTPPTCLTSPTSAPSSPRPFPRAAAVGCRCTCTGWPAFRAARGTRSCDLAECVVRGRSRRAPRCTSTARPS